MRKPRIEKYYLKLVGALDWTEVTKSRFVNAEKSVGLIGETDEFSNGIISGKIEYVEGEENER